MLEGKTGQSSAGDPQGSMKHLVPEQNSCTYIMITELIFMLSEAAVLIE
jgi:hypothetical protein